MLKSLSTTARNVPLQFRRFFSWRIWQPEHIGSSTRRGRYYAALRVLAITAAGVRDNDLLNRAASMSFYSLIAMGPLIAVIVMISGIVLRGQEDEFVIDTLNSIVEFVAPPVAAYSRLEDARDPQEIADETVVNVELVDLLNTIIESAQTAGGGLIGALILVFIALKLLTTTEKTYNGIWGVSRGRSWAERIVFYWTFISLGAVLGFGALGMFTTTTIASLLQWVPIGAPIIERIILGVVPLMSFFVVVVLLASFYVFFPNTTVRWRAAFIGAVLVAVLLFLNNYFSVLYVHRVIANRSLYGSVGIVPVLMIGLYVFWFFLLVGGQLTYAVQNANLLTGRRAWNNISFHSREILILAVFLVIARRFHNCEQAPSTPELGEVIRVPANIINESLRILREGGWVSAVKDPDDSGAPDDARFRPARPLNRTTLSELYNGLSHTGIDSDADLIGSVDPLLDRYRDVRRRDALSAFETTDLETLLSETDALPQRPSGPRAIGERERGEQEASGS